MGIDNGGKVVAKMNKVVARELDLMLDYISSKHASNSIAETSNTTKKSIACDVSNIIHKLAYRRYGNFSTALVRDVANFLKQLAADTGYVVTPILDGDIRPQTKRDAFKRRFDSTMNRVNSFFCRQAAMKLAAKPEGERTNDEKIELVEYNKEAKRLETATRLHIPVSFKEELELALDEVGAYFPDRQSGGVVSRNTIKAEYESDYIMAHRIRNKQDTLVYSSDADMTALCGPTCLCICSFGEENKRTKKRKNGDNDGEQTIYSYEVTCGSNTLLNEIKDHITAHLDGSSKIVYTEAPFPLFEEDTPPFITALYAVGLGCDVLPGGVPNITPMAITKELKRIHDESVVSPQDYSRR